MIILFLKWFGKSNTTGSGHSVSNVSLIFDVSPGLVNAIANDFFQFQPKCNQVIRRVSRANGKSSKRVRRWGSTAAKRLQHHVWRKKEGIWKCKQNHFKMCIMTIKVILFSSSLWWNIYRSSPVSLMHTKQCLNPKGMNTWVPWTTLWPVYRANCMGSGLQVWLRGKP